MAERKSQSKSGTKEDIIRCPCGIKKQSDPRAFMRCDTCDVWQHNICVGYSDKPEDNPPQYHCEQCNPGEHPLLVQWSAKGLKKMRDFVRLRNERAQLVLGTADEVADKKAWLVLECNALIGRVKEVENYWHLYLTSETAPVEDGALAVMKEEVLVAIKAIVLRMCLADVDAFRTDMLKRLRLAPVLQIEIMWELRKKITRKMLASWKETDDTPTEGLVRRYFDQPR